MNQISAKINEVHHSGSVILVDFETESHSLSAMLIDSAVKPEWLTKDNIVFAIFKETEVSIAKSFTGLISLRNKLPCVIRNIERGQLMSVITLKFGKYFINSAITTRSVDILSLNIGDDVLALIKANEIALMQK